MLLPCSFPVIVTTHWTVSHRESGLSNIGKWAVVFTGLLRRLTRLEALLYCRVWPLVVDSLDHRRPPWCWTLQKNSHAGNFSCTQYRSWIRLLDGTMRWISPPLTFVGSLEHPYDAHGRCTREVRAKPARHLSIWRLQLQRGVNNFSVTDMQDIPGMKLNRDSQSILLLEGRGMSKTEKRC